MNKPGITIPLEDLKARVCSCGNDIFIQALRLREVPAVYSQNGKIATAEIQVGYLCAKCGCSLSRVPVQEREPEKSPLVVS